jgi:uncharacterized protein YuzE
MRDIHFSYDEEGDVLYIAFHKGRKATSVSLNDNIVLRFDPETQKAVGLTLLDFSRLMEAPDPSPLWRLAELPATLRDMVWTVLTQPPISLYLCVATSPTEAHPAATLAQELSLADLLMVAA